MIREYKVTFSAEEKGQPLYSFATIKAQTFSEAGRDAFLLRHKRGLDWVIESIVLKKD